MVGLENIIAVATRDAVFLASKDQAHNITKIVDKMHVKGCHQAITHPREYRPWGWYEGLSIGNNYKVKCLMVKPGVQLSLQSHAHRAEHWIVISGAVDVTLEDRQFRLTENQSTYIPIEAVHRLANPGSDPALLIEVQTGSYLSEDDIIRFEDDYNRSNVSKSTSIFATQ